MRHRKKFNHLSRTSAHRKAMIRNMAISLLTHKRIHTTTAKAKALRMFIEPIITKAKEDTTHNRRVVFAAIQDKEIVSMLFREIAEKIGDRPGGYTRILKTGNRLGDNADMCFIELVDYNENMLSASEGKKSTRSRRSRKKATVTAEAAPAATEASVEEPKAAAEGSEEEKKEE